MSDRISLAFCSFQLLLLLNHEDLSLLDSVSAEGGLVLNIRGYNSSPAPAGLPRPVPLPPGGGVEEGGAAGGGEGVSQSVQHLHLLLHQPPPPG